MVAVAVVGGGSSRSHNYKPAGGTDHHYESASFQVAATVAVTGPNLAASLARTWRQTVVGPAVFDLDDMMWKPTATTSNPDACSGQITNTAGAAGHHYEKLS